MGSHLSVNQPIIDTKIYKKAYLLSGENCTATKSSNTQ